MQTTLPLTTTQTTGILGEQVAQNYLQSQNYSIYRVNERIKYDEIDIIAYDHTDKVLVFIEVKTRTRANSFFNPMLNITYKKKRAMFRAARTWLAKQEYTGPYRVDVIGVVGNRVTEHLVEIGSE